MGQVIVAATGADELMDTSKELDEIWDGDLLRRREEARLLEQVIYSEVKNIVARGRDQALVLAIDSPYGEGKTWFLERLSAQLSINHPVAFVDAWIDDGAEEPLVPFMAALEEAFQPFIERAEVKEKLKGLARAALPIIGKAAVAAGGKWVARYIGETFIEDAAKTLRSSRDQAHINGAAGEALKGGVDESAKGINSLIDSAAEHLLADYRERKRSRSEFKAKLSLLAKAVPEAGGTKRGPIIIFVDELDRCRPSFAIKLLEEIKHLFDIREVVFIISIHGKQLEHSIRAIYGSGFDSFEYLRRFFTRSYPLRRLSIIELVRAHFPELRNDISFSFPESWNGDQAHYAQPPMVVGALLGEWGASAREALAVLDALRLFCECWEEPNLKIELILVTAMIFNILRGKDAWSQIESVADQEIAFVSSDNIQDFNSKPLRVGFPAFLTAYNNGRRCSLPDALNRGSRAGSDAFIDARLSDEFAVRFQRRYSLNSPPMSIWTQYPDRIKSLARFVVNLSTGDQLPTD